MNSMTKTCEYCNKSLDLGNYRRWHGENCKSKPVSKILQGK